MSELGLCSDFTCKHLDPGDSCKLVDFLIDDDNRLRKENAKLRELCRRFAEYVSHDRCEGCVCKSRCNDGKIEECWQRTEIREIAHELGIEVCV